MMNTNTPATTMPWYRVPAVWLVLAIPGLTIAGCALTIYLALTNPDVVYERTESPSTSASMKR